MKFKTIIGKTESTFEMNFHSNRIEVFQNGKSVNAEVVKLSDHSYSIIVEGKSHIVSLMNGEDSVSALINQKKSQIVVKDETQILLETYGFAEPDSNHVGEIHAPIPGLVTKLFVSIDNVVEKGQKIFILEAMKMENEIVSPISGSVTKILVEEGKAVQKGQLILHIAADK
jgi:biotin carboxyl carrier protein